MHEPKLSRLFERYRANNDLSALAEVFDAVSVELLRVARHVAGRGIDPEDLVQATFLAAIERASTFDTSRPLVPWLMGILINQSRLARRRANPNLSEETARDLPDVAMVEDTAEQHEVDEAVTRALSTLPDTYREVLVPHLAEGKKPHEIARQLGRPQGTVRAQIHRGIRLVRKALPAGFAVGMFGVLRGSSLAQVRETVLHHAAHAAGQGPSAVIAVNAARAARVVRRRLAALGTAAVLGGVLWLAWPANGNAGSGAGAFDVAAAGTSSSEKNTLAPVERGTRASATAAENSISTPSAGEPYGSVRVRVLAAEGEEVLQGVRVTLLAWGDPHWYETPRVMLSGADGTAWFEHVHAGRVGLHLDGGPQTRADVVAGQETKIDARRLPGMSVFAIVRDGHGNPVPNAVIDVFDARDGLLLRTSEPAGEDGRIVMDDVSERAWVAARADGYGSSDLVWLGLPRYKLAGGKAAAGAELALDVRTGGLALDGVVLDAAGQIVPGARITVSPPRADEPLWRADGSAAFEPPASTVTSDTGGRFRVEGLRPHVHVLRVEAQGLSAFETRIEPARGAFESQTVRLGPGAVVHGLVRFDDGSPAPSARVEAAHVKGGPVLVAVSDARGAFRIEGLETGRAQVQARAGGIGPTARAEIVVQPGQPTEWNPVVEHQETIQGSAIGEDGRHVKTWLVLAVPESDVDDRPEHALGRWARASVPGDEEALLLQCWIDNHGRFVVPCRSGSAHRVELRPRGAWQGVVQAVERGVRPGARDVELRVRRARGGLQGRFVDESNAPIAMGIVVAVSQDIAAETRATVDPITGRFELDLLPGRYDLLTWPPRGAPWHVGRYEVPARAPMELGDIVVPAAGELVVATRGFTPVSVELTSERGLRCEMVSTPAQEYAAQELQPGKYRVVITKTGGERMERDAEVRAGETARVTIAQP
jgi:RNA polymerase sigma-70 factor (ECF subfamily)